MDEYSQMLRDAVASYKKNPYWAGYYDDAPSDNCRKLIAAIWVSSLFHVPESDDEFVNLRLKLEENLTREDWEHLYWYAGNTTWRGYCNQKIQEMS